MLYVRLIISYVRLIISYVWLIISYIRDNKLYVRLKFYIYCLYNGAYTAYIMAHRVVNYFKSEADNTSVFLLMDKKAKYLEAFTYIFKYLLSFGIPRSYLTSLSSDGKRIWHIWCNTVHTLHLHNCFRSGCRVLQETSRLLIQRAYSSSNCRLWWQIFLRIVDTEVCGLKTFETTSSKPSS